MWKHHSGSWQERLKRAATPSPSSTSPLPSSTENEPSTHPLRFLNSHFTDTQPLVEFPNLQESVAAGSVGLELPLTPWVAFSGVDGGHVLLLRAHLDVSVGHTTAHYVPLHSKKIGKVVYICFEQVSDAYWMVRKGGMRLHYDEGNKTLLGTSTVREWNSSNCYSFEVDAFWCTDELFLEKYARHTRDYSDRQICEYPRIEGENPFSFRANWNPLTKGKAPHPTASSTPTSKVQHADTLYEGFSSSSSSLDENPAMKYDGNVFSITSLVYTPAADNVFYQLLHLAWLLAWIFFRIVSFALCSGSSTQVPNSPEHACPHKLDTSSLSSSPIQYLSHWLAFHISFAPSVSEVNLCLWSYWHRGNPHPQRALLERLHEIQKTTHYFSPKQLTELQQSPSADLYYIPSLFIWKSSRAITRYSFLASCLYILLVLWAIF